MSFVQDLCALVQVETLVYDEVYLRTLLGDSGGFVDEFVESVESELTNSGDGW